MQELNRITIPLTGKPSYGCPPRSLCWHGEELVDWVAGGVRYSLDGTVTSPHVNYAYRFDAAVISPGGEYAVIYERLGTKGLLLKNGKILRELNRSYYCAEVYEYPVTFLPLPNGQIGLAHCPEEYCRLEVEEVESGERLTGRTTEPEDFFYSRLSASRDGRYLASAGWVWHPFEDVRLFDVAAVLAQPELLDKGLQGLNGPQGLVPWGVTINMAVLAGRSTLVLTTANDGYESDEEDEDNQQSLLLPNQIAVYDMATRQISSHAPLHEAAGVILPLNSEWVIGCYQYLKLIHVPSGQVVTKWEELKSGEQMSCIINAEMHLPPVAVDPHFKRVAISSADEIAIIEFG